MKEYIKKLLREGLLDDIGKLKSHLSKYGDLADFYETPVGYKFIINKAMDLYNIKGFELPKIELTYITPENSHGRESIWTITKYDSTPLGRDRQKVLISSNNVDEIIKTMDKLVKYIIKNKELKESLMTESYTDSRTGKQYSDDDVKQWIKQYQRYGLPNAEKVKYVTLFNALGLRPKDYKKEKPKSILKLKKNIAGSYYSEGDIDGYKVRAEFDNDGNKWCVYWFINGVEVDSDCGIDFKHTTSYLDDIAKHLIQEYKKKHENK